MDILIARRLADELFASSEERLKEISEIPGVFLSVASLSGIQIFINSYGKSKIGAEELLFLNGLSSSIASSPKCYVAREIITYDKRIADTLADMMAKYAFLTPLYTSPCSLERALTIGGEAIAYGKPGSFSMGEHSVISSGFDDVSALNAVLSGLEVKHCKNGICIAKNIGYKKKKSVRSGKKYQVSFFYTNEDSDLNDLLDFSRDVCKLTRTVSAFAAKETDLFIELCQHSRKLAVFADRIPSSPSANDSALLTDSERTFLSVSDFLFNRDGKKCAVAVISKLKDSKKRLNKLAKKYGLDHFHPIEITKDPRLTFYSKKTVVSSLSSDVLRLVMRSKALEVTVPAQANDINYIPNEKVYGSKETAEIVYRAVASLADDTKCFGAGLSAVLSPFISAAYDGINSKSSTFAVSLSLNVSLSDMGGAYGAILGIYRAITELGVAVEAASVSITDSEPSVTAVLKAQSHRDPIPLNTALSPEELFSFFVKDGNMPDFSAFRSFINGENP